MDTGCALTELDKSHALAIRLDEVDNVSSALQDRYPMLNELNVKSVADFVTTLVVRAVSHAQ